jgi:hypothetical protein
MDGGPGPPYFLIEKKSHRKILADFAVGPLPFGEIKPQSTKIPRRHLIFKIIPDIALPTSRNYKKVPTTSIHHIFATVTPISAILASKFLELLPISSYAFINTCLLHID